MPIVVSHWACTLYAIALGYALAPFMATAGAGVLTLNLIGRLNTKSFDLVPSEINTRFAIIGAVGTVGSIAAIWLWLRGRRDAREQGTFLHCTPFWWHVLPPLAFIVGGTAGSLLVWCAVK